MQDTDLQRALAACRGALAVVMAFSFGVNLLALASPLYMLQLYDRVLPSRSTDTLLLLVLIVIGALAVLSALDGLRRRMLAGIADWLEDRAGPAVVGAGLRAALHGGARRGLDDLATLRGFIGGGGAIPLLDAPWTPLFLGALFVLHPLLGVIGVVGAAILLLLAVANEAATRRPLQRASAAAAIAAERTDAALRNAEVVRALGMEEGVVALWRRGGREAQALLDRAGRRQNLLFSLSRFARMAVQTAIMGAAAWLAIHQMANAGVIFAASFLLSRALAPVENAIGTWRSLVAARTACRRLNEALAQAPSRRPAMALPDPAGDLEVEHVTFLPPGSSRMALRNVSFRLAAGEVLAVVGPSAAGKSTLARLIAGAWAPSAGSVRLDGADVAGWLDSGGARHFGYLPQDVELFAGTVYDNIARLGHAAPHEVVEAARLAGLHDTILRLPQGYETEIGENGVRLSGGQRQRLGLARALLGRPRLIVLDEPNASLDAEGEGALLDAIRHVKACGSTVVVVTHRPGILGLADRILMLRNGVVEVFGLRSEMIARLNAAPPAPQAGAAAQRRLS